MTWLVETPVEGGKRAIAAFTRREDALTIVEAFKARRIRVGLREVALDEITLADFDYVAAKRHIPGRGIQVEEKWGVEGLQYRKGEGVSRIEQESPFKGPSAITAITRDRDRAAELIEMRMEEVPFITPIAMPYTGPVDERTGKPPVKSHVKHHPAPEQNDVEEEATREVAPRSVPEGSGPQPARVAEREPSSGRDLQEEGGRFYRRAGPDPDAASTRGAPDRGEPGVLGREEADVPRHHSRPLVGRRDS